MIFLYIILLSVLSGVLGRLGGKGGHWWANTKMRDLGCPACMLAVILIKGIWAPWWIHFIAFGLMFATLCTYWDSLFGFDNHWFHGFMIGIAYLPYCFTTGHWVLYAIRCLVLAVWMGAWSKAWKNDTIEEFGRYAILPVTVFLI